MERETGSIQQELPRSDVNNTLYGNFAEALQTDDYEVALQATNEIRDINTWRTATRSSPFPQFYRLFEVATRVNGTHISSEQRGVLREEVFDQLYPLTRTMSPRVRDIYASLLAEVSGVSLSPELPMTERQLDILKDTGDLRLLQDPSIPWSMKLNRMQTRIESELLGRKALDRRDDELAKEEQREKGEGEEQENTTAPPASDESKPSMDEMERLKEGEQASAIWTIAPAYGGYYKEQAFDTWDAATNTWKRADHARTPVNYENLDRAEAELTISTRVPMQQWTRIPIPYQYKISDIRMGNSDFLLAKDKNGDYLIQSTDQHANVSPHALKIEMTKKDNPDVSENPPSKSLSIPAKLSEETGAQINRVGQTRNTNISKARALALYTMRHLQYSNDSSYNVLYENFQNGYIAAIDQFQKADCDVANTYFAALCNQLEIPVRHVVGHMVKGKDAQGNSRITSGTGHAWTEVWDETKKIWVRMDATPAGDPQMEDEQEQEELVPGDYGEGPEAVAPTDEQLLELEEKLATLTERLSYTPEERRLSEATGVEPKEARQILREINEAEQTRLPNGELVVNVMSQLFSLIVDSRKTTIPGYTGPVRKREGGEEIEDIIMHKIGIAAGESDPASRKKEHEEIKQIPVFDGMDAFIIGDKSGSMNETVDGDTKWWIQRRAEYLILSSLYRFEQNLQRATTRMLDPLSVRSEAISFRNGDEIDTDKPLSNQFAPEDKVRLWKSLGNQGTGNGDVPALKQIYGEIVEEQKALGKQPEEKDTRLRIVIACSDGKPDDVSGVHQMAENLGRLNAVVVGIGLTETALQVPIIFDTPYSRGDIAKDINDLPVIVAKHIIQEAAKLFPERTKPLYQKQIDAILAKFDRVGYYKT